MTIEEPIQLHDAMAVFEAGAEEKLNYGEHHGI